MFTLLLATIQMYFLVIFICPVLLCDYELISLYVVLYQTLRLNIMSRLIAIHS